MSTTTTWAPWVGLSSSKHERHGGTPRRPPEPSEAARPRAASFLRAQAFGEAHTGPSFLRATETEIVRRDNAPLLREVRGPARCHLRVTCHKGEPRLSHVARFALRNGHANFPRRLPTGLERRNRRAWPMDCLKAIAHQRSCTPGGSLPLQQDASAHPERSNLWRRSRHWKRRQRTATHPSPMLRNPASWRRSASRSSPLTGSAECTE